MALLHTRPVSLQLNNAFRSRTCTYELATNAVALADAFPSVAVLGIVHRGRTQGLFSLLMNMYVNFGQQSLFLLCLSLYFFFGRPKCNNSHILSFFFRIYLFFSRTQVMSSLLIIHVNSEQKSLYSLSFCFFISSYLSLSHAVSFLNSLTPKNKGHKLGGIQKESLVHPNAIILIFSPSSCSLSICLSLCFFFRSFSLSQQSPYFFLLSPFLSFSLCHFPSVAISFSRVLKCCFPYLSYMSSLNNNPHIVYLTFVR